MYFKSCKSFTSRERVYVSDRSTIETLSSANAAGRIHRQHVSAEVSPQETAENTINLQAGEDAQENTGTHYYSGAYDNEKIK